MSHEPSSASAGCALRPFTTLSLDQYLIGACAEKKERLLEQDRTARTDNSIKCGCGFTRWIGYAYRCLYCGEWYCAACAEAHFGQTLDEWIIKKRIEKRQEIEARRHNASIQPASEP